jgi:protein-L-isoaspartate(D-aspartate) O-methyltransferase
MFYSYNDLTEHLIATQALHTPKIIDAFRHIDRADFAPETMFENVYGDYPLQIGYGQTISQPTTVAMMMEMLQPKEGENILDIGSGSAWTTAILAYIVKESGFVTGTERVDQLMKKGIQNLSKYGFKNAKITYAGEKLGIPGKKFDKILVSAAAKELPNELIMQLNKGGKLVIPVQNYIYEITKLENEKIELIKHYGFSFVPLIY